MLRKGAGILVLGLFAFALMPAHAEDFAGDVPDLVWIDLGGAYNEVGTNVALFGPKGLGATIDFEETFDLPGTKTVGRMLGTARISPKRRYIDFGYVDVDRKGSRTLTQDIEFGDYTFKAGGQVSARFATQFIYAAFRYDFLHEDKIRISGSAGMTWLRLKASLQGQANFVEDSNGNTITTDFEKEGSTGAPVPMVGLNLDWALTRRLLVRTYNRFFKLNLDSFNGGLYENGIRLNWYFAKYFGLGLGFDRSNLKLKELKVGQGNVIKADYGVSGVGLYANMAF
jgi:hypothetical protein